MCTLALERSVFVGRGQARTSPSLRRPAARFAAYLGSKIRTTTKGESDQVGRLKPVFSGRINICRRRDLLASEEWVPSSFPLFRASELSQLEGNVGSPTPFARLRCVLSHS
jgi:hypothetical protein